MQEATVDERPASQAVYAQPLTTDDRKVLRKLEKSPWNRLHSIDEDARWVEHVADAVPGDLPFVANLRCGAWYLSPKVHVGSADETYCYFKSTDGHAGEWSFSLKRPNLDVARVIQQRGGVVIVDSTRRGKSLPDALSKTIPIWCAVLTEASRRKYGGALVHDAPATTVQMALPFREVNASKETALRTPRHQVPPSEHAQMKTRISAWVQQLLHSDLPIPRLDRPLLPFFLTRPAHASDEAQIITQLSQSSLPTAHCYPVVLLSASRRVEVPTPSLDGSFYYTQGSGDDEELWSFGLRPKLFWDASVHSEIMSGPPDGIAERIRLVVARHNESSAEPPGSPAATCVQIGTTCCFLALSTAAKSAVADYSLVIDCGSSVTSTAAAPEDPVVHCPVAPGKKGLRDFRAALDRILTLATKTLYSEDGLAKAGATILVMDSNEAVSDAQVAIVVALLAAFYTHALQPDASNATQRIEAQNGPAHLCPTLDRARSHRQKSLTKEEIRRRLQWVVSQVPQANPSRRHMQRVNEVLLEAMSREADQGDRVST
ncbi:unnamed protein product [Jaminaea pallidilutea]